MCVGSIFIKTLHLATSSTSYNSTDVMIGHTKHRWMIMNFPVSISFSSTPPPPLALKTDGTQERGNPH
jgi:hypothetical protein